MSKRDWSIIVKTGDHKGSGSDADIFVAFTDKSGISSTAKKLDVAFRDDFERGKEDKFPCEFLARNEKMEIPWTMELWVETSGCFLWQKEATASWFCERVTLITPIETLDFPVLRWVKPGIHYKIPVNDTSLPEDDPFPEQRTRELEVSRERYKIKVIDPELPITVEELPPEEMFSDDTLRDMEFVKKTTKWGVLYFFLDFRKWTKFEHLDRMYTIEKSFKKPRGCKFWDSDEWFGAQRLVGVNPMTIRLCTRIPETSAVNNDLVSPYLEGMTLEEAIEKKRLFIVDYVEASGILGKDDCHICSPIALFFLNGKKKLMPVSIQLYQGKHNPVFTPGIDKNKWILVKSFFKTVDSFVHENIVHLAFTHLVMGSVLVCIHRCLSKNHPIFKLLAPHFIYLLAINTRGLPKLMDPGAILDLTLIGGSEGGYEIIKRLYKEWSLDVNGTLPKDLESRGVDDPSVLPEYPYRDDGLLVYNAIKEYVTDIVNIYYDSPEKISNDTELNEWAKLMATSRQDGGAGIKGIPNNGRFDSTEDIVSTCTSLIFTGSAQHAAVNFGQYDQYAHFLNQSTKLRGCPPTNMDPLTEEDVLSYAPSKPEMVKMFVMAKALSFKGTNSLGDWEVRYQYDPRAIAAEERFRNNLKSVSAKIKKRNEARSEMFQYDYLDPANIPNAISI